MVLEAQLCDYIASTDDLKLTAMVSEIFHMDIEGETAFMF